MSPSEAVYRGRLAPSPTGFLHLGHARTFWIAQERSRAHAGTLILRNDDLDRARCRPEFSAAMLEDLRWFGLEWTEGPDCGGPLGPYAQSQRLHYYRAALNKLIAGGWVYPCTCSRKDILAASRAPHGVDDEEPVYPGTCRGRRLEMVHGQKFSWRYRVPDGHRVEFTDENLGRQQFVAGRDFGDFVVWRHDEVPAYQLACTVDDAAMRITEVVRGADLLLSTARQRLLYNSLALVPPAFYHCQLMVDETGQRLAKRHEALSLRTLRQHGWQPEALQSSFKDEIHRVMMGLRGLPN